MKYKITAIILLLGGAILSFADMHEAKSMPGHGPMHADAKMEQDKAGMHRMDMDCDMHHMRGKMPMMQGMMRPEVVSTTDGGIVVVIGGYVLKYDSDLNLVKKTEIDIGPDDMKAMMKKHDEMHRMMMDTKMNKPKKSE